MPYLLLPQEAQFFRNVRKALSQLYQMARSGTLRSLAHPARASALATILDHPGDTTMGTGG